MNCAPFDLQDYFFDALPAPYRHAVEEHLGQCGDCAAELERLRLTGLALAAIPDEELPRRIGFVSDKVFAPSLVARWWQSLWMSGARLASVSMALLAVAILVHAFRPQPPPVVAVAAPHSLASPASDPAAIKSEIDKAVTRAVAVTEARYDAKLNQIMAENARQKVMMERAAETIDRMERRASVFTVASNRENVPPVGGQ
jgi:hypothetical protein